LRGFCAFAFTAWLILIIGGHRKLIIVIQAAFAFYEDIAGTSTDKTSRLAQK
jgi:hypothetical protein